MGKTRQRRMNGWWSGICAVVLGMVALPAPASGGTVGLTWDRSPSGDVAGYRVYYQANSKAAPFVGGGAAEGASPIDVGDATSATISGLDSANSYYFAVTAYDSAGTESDYSTVVEINDWLPPSVSLTSPASGATISGAVTVKAVASDNRAVDRVAFFLNGEELGECAAPPYSVTLNAAAVPPGSYALIAKAYDASGNEGVSAPLPVKVAGETTSPAVSIVWPPSGSSVKGAVAVSAIATDNTGIAELELTCDGALLFAGNQGRVDYTLNSSSVGNGSHALCATAYDFAGNASRACVTVVVQNDSLPADPPSVPAAADGSEAQINFFRWRFSWWQWQYWRR